MQRLRSFYHPAHLVTGLSIWSLWFVALYGGQGVGCSVAPPALEDGPWTWLNLALGLLSLLATVVLLWLAYHCREQRQLSLIHISEPTRPY